MAETADIEQLAREQVLNFLNDSIPFYDVVEDLTFDRDIPNVREIQEPVYERANAILNEIYNKFVNEKENQ